MISKDFGGLVHLNSRVVGPSYSNFLLLPGKRASDTALSCFTPRPVPVREAEQEQQQEQVQEQKQEQQQEQEREQGEAWQQHGPKPGRPQRPPPPPCLVEFPSYGAGLEDMKTVKNKIEPEPIGVGGELSLRPNLLRPTPGSAPKEERKEAEELSLAEEERARSSFPAAGRRSRVASGCKEKKVPSGEYLPEGAGTRQKGIGERTRGNCLTTSYGQGWLGLARSHGGAAARQLWRPGALRAYTDSPGNVARSLLLHVSLSMAMAMHSLDGPLHSSCGLKVLKALTSLLAVPAPVPTSSSSQWSFFFFFFLPPRARRSAISSRPSNGSTARMRTAAPGPGDSRSNRSSDWCNIVSDVAMVDVADRNVGVHIFLSY
ncbi:I/6 autoantigen [Frankliniella fusca]|uniref:I/6 autoantigen n=1 Tax=Frankliniella fusca TaxID=407009 RepID=A0AAE1LTG2_9NEOP|nr:I/6 autoantigen [Frankliniella fusca]